MRLTLIITFLMFSAKAFACSNAIKSYSEECLLQDRFLKVKNEFKKNSINVEDLQAYKIARISDWTQWNNGQQFISSLRGLQLGMSDILKLHKSIFATNESGKFRTDSGITKPKEEIACQAYLLNSESIASITNSDLQSEENYPLLELENVQACSKKGFYSATLVYYKGASVKAEMDRWLVDFNDMMNRFESDEMQDVSPLQYIADMRRWFMAISPFAQGNAEVINALSDYYMKRLNLLPLPLVDFNKPQLLSVEKNRMLIKQRSQDVLSFVESCLQESKSKSVSMNCTLL